jgi:quercetin dioxygenase-like cupin family protein
MIVAKLDDLDLQEEWSEGERTERLRSAFALHRKVGTVDSTVIYFELPPGGAVATHTDSAEEVILVLEGVIQVAVGEEEGRLTAGELALVPAAVPHSVRNAGDSAVRAIGFFSGGRVISTFERPLQPSGLSVFDTDEL